MYLTANAEVTIVNSLLQDNIASRGGGGVFASRIVALAINGTTFAGNAALTGGAMQVRAGLGDYI